VGRGFKERKRGLIFIFPVSLRFSTLLEGFPYLETITLSIFLPPTDFFEAIFGFFLDLLTLEGQDKYINKKKEVNAEMKNRILDYRLSKQHDVEVLFVVYLKTLLLHR
jgi:hypothetical protein